MEQSNWLIIPIAAFIPLILGFIWYHPKVLGAKLAQINGESVRNNPSIGKLLLSYLFSIILAYILTLMSVHQSAIFQLFFMDPELANANSEYNLFIQDFMTKYGDRHRSFGHGVVHGTEAGFMFGLAFFGISTLMQDKPLKQIWIHLGFWMLCCGLVGGTVCAFF